MRGRRLATCQVPRTLRAGEVCVSEETLDVLVAGYQDLGAARRDFDVLCGLVRDTRVAAEYGVILVAKDADGKVTLADTGGSPGPQGRRLG